MRNELLEALKPSVEILELAGRKIHIRELTCEDAEAISAGDDAAYKLIVLCTFDADGNRIFGDEDIPALKKAGRGHLMQIMNAVNKINSGSQ